NVDQRGRQMRQRLRCLSTVVCLGMLLTACGSSEPFTSAIPVAPTPFTSTAPLAPVVPSLELSGVVTENGHPVENAAVEVQWLCGLSQGRIPYVVAQKEGYNSNTSPVEPGTDTSFDIQLRR